jgi:hypothetical protein
VEAERRIGLAQKFTAFGAFEVRVEDETARVGILQKDHAHIRMAVRIDGRNRHRVRLVGLGLRGFFHPLGEERHRVVLRRDAAVV